MSASLRHARSIALRTFVGLASLTVTIGAAALGEGCGPGAPKTDNLCGWLGATENCYRTFAEDIGDRCGSTDENQKKGSFGKREALDICILKGGGQAIFDPPLDPTKLPPEKVGFKLLDLTGSECGSGSWELAGQDLNDDEISYTFSITVKGDDLGNGGAGGAGGGGGAGGTGGLDPSIVVGGTYTSVVAEGGDFFDATCADGEAFKFNLLSIDRCDASQELSEDYSKLIPRARLVWSSGGVDVPGRLRFSVLYPPLAPADLNGATPTEMVYFDCDIPPAPKPCFNGAQDGAETDVDCGGSSTIFDSCQYDCPRCGDGAKCGSDCDCDPATVCDFVMGFKKCIADPMAKPAAHQTNTCDVDLSTTPECLAQGGGGGAGGSGTGGGGAGGGGAGGAGGAGGGGAGGN